MFIELRKEEVKRVFFQVLQTTREVGMSILWIFLIILFTFPSWFLRYAIGLPQDKGFGEFLWSAMITSSKVGEVLIVNGAVAFFIWFDAIVIGRKSVNIRRKLWVTISALFCAIVSGCLWVVSSEKVSVSIGELWRSETFRIILYSTLFIVWFFMKYLVAFPKIFTETDPFGIDTTLEGRIRRLGINNKKAKY